MKGKECGNNIEILKCMGELPISNTQKISVLIVRGLDGKPELSVQKWWRTDSKQDWIIGKGFRFGDSDIDEIFKLGNMIIAGGKEIGNN